MFFDSLSLLSSLSSSEILGNILAFAIYCLIYRVSASYSAAFCFSTSCCSFSSSITFNFSIKAWSLTLLLLVELHFDDDLDDIDDFDDLLDPFLEHFLNSALVEFPLCVLQSTVLYI